MTDYETGETLVVTTDIFLSTDDRLPIVQEGDLVEFVDVQEEKLIVAVGDFLALDPEDVDLEALT